MARLPVRPVGPRGRFAALHRSARAWFAAALVLLATSVPPAAVARAETVWSRWSGAWEVALDRQPDGATCLWSTYDAPPPGHVRRLSFAVNRRGEVVVILSDRRQPLHRIAAGPSGLFTLRDRQYAIEIGAGIPLEGLPGGMLVGRVVREDAAGFLRAFGRPGRDVEEAHVLLPGGWSWRMSLRGATAAAEDVLACMAKPGVGGTIR